MRLLLRLCLGLLVLIVATGGLLFLTAPTAKTPATVTDDDTLPAIEVNQVRLHAQRFGPDGAPPVIVLHGGPGADHRSLLPLVDLADAYRVTFYDQRGAGLSERVAADTLNLDGYLSELDALIGMQGEPVILIGHSWGAMLAHAYVGQHPDRVERMVLIEPGFLSADEQAQWQARAEGYSGGVMFIWHVLTAVVEALKSEAPDTAAVQDHIWGRMVGHFANAADNPYHCAGDRYDSPAWRFGAVASNQSAKASVEDLNRLSHGTRFSGPILFMTGACDSWIGRNLQEPRLDRYANARLVDIANAGHDVIDDQPDAAIAAIRQFLREK